MTKFSCDSCNGTGEVEINDLCNFCGLSCTRSMSGNDKSFYGVQVSYIGGYLSTEFEDNKTYKFQLCENCLSVLMENFSIPVESE